MLYLLSSLAYLPDLGGFISELQSHRQDGFAKLLFILIILTSYILAI